MLRLDSEGEVGGVLAEGEGCHFVKYRASGLLCPGFARGTGRHGGRYLGTVIVPPTGHTLEARSQACRRDFWVGVRNREHTVHTPPKPPVHSPTLLPLA